MEHDLVLEGRVVTKRGIEELEVGVTDGMIVDVRKQGLKGEKRIRGESALIFPGFVDAHVHLREPGWEYKEDFRTGSEAAAHGGVTTVADMPNNPRPAVSREALALKRRLAEVKSLVSVELYGGVVPGSLDSVSAMAEIAVGYKIYLAKTTGDGMLPLELLPRALGAISETGKPVGVHCEDQSMVDTRSEELKDDRRPDAYCDVRPPEAEAASVRALLSAAENVKGLRFNVCHSSTSDTVSAVAGGKARGLNVTCEAALHHLYFNRKAMFENRLLRTNPPLRGEPDRRSLVEGLSSGRVSMLVTDHAPHLEEEKLSEGLSGVPGLDDFGHVVSWLIREQGVDPMRVLQAACSNPARHLGLGDRGEVAAGMRADLVVLDLRSPEKVTPDSVRSRCRWSPYEGKVFPGRVRWTVRGGVTLVDDYELSV